MIALGYHPDDILTDVLPFPIMLAIIVPSPPGTAVHWAVDETYAKAAAPPQQTQAAPPQQQQVPMSSPGGPNRAVNLEARRRGPVTEKVVGFDSMTIDQWERIKAENWARPPSRETKRAI